MPTWVENLLMNFFNSHGFVSGESEFTQSYVKVSLDKIGELELNFFPHDESLLFSLRLNGRVEESILLRILQCNDYRRLRPFSPTGHVFGESVVLRLLLQREHIETSNLELILSNFKRVNHEIMGT